MGSDIVRHIIPEEAELERKREELATVRSALAERELELADLRAELRSFEGRYLRQVGVLYAELDDWDARIAELESELETNTAAQQRAQRARERANETHEATHGEASQVAEFKPSADLKSLFREVAKQIHPDLCKDDPDRQRRTRLMAEANEAYARGDAEALRRILDKFRDSADAVQGEGIAAELIRIIRQIAEARKRISVIEQQLAELRVGELAMLYREVQNAQCDGRDLLAELATGVRDQVIRAKKEYEAMIREAKQRAR